MFIKHHKRAHLHTGSAPFLHNISSGICSVGDDDDDSDDDSGGGGGGKSFSQDEVNALLAKERKRAAKKLEGLDELKSKAGQVDELADKIRELEEAAEMAGKDSAERAKMLAEKAQAQAAKRVADLESQVQTLTSERDGASSSLTAYIKRTHATDALAKAGVLQGASKHALRAFLEEASIELDEDGKVSGAEYGEVPQSLESAAEAFLSENDIFKAAKPGGGGTRTPTSGGLTDKDVDNMSASELAAHGWAQAPAPRTGDRVERELDQNNQ